MPTEPVCMLPIFVHLVPVAVIRFKFYVLKIPCYPVYFFMLFRPFPCSCSSGMLACVGRGLYTLTCLLHFTLSRPLTFCLHLFSFSCRNLRQVPFILGKISRVFYFHPKSSKNDIKSSGLDLDQIDDHWQWSSMSAMTMECRDGSNRPKVRNSVRQVKSSIRRQGRLPERHQGGPEMTATPLPSRTSART
jgi:hypothetical protein